MKSLITGSRSFIGQALLKEFSDLDFFHANKEFYSKSARGRKYPKIQNVFNLAAAGSKRGNYTDSDMFQTNVVQLRDMMYSVGSWDRFYQFGTSSEYGNVNEAMREDMPSRPRFMYATTKAMATDFCLGFANERGLSMTIIRPFSVFGNGMQSTKLIPTVINAVKKGMPISLVDGQHDYIHIDDFTSAMRCIHEKRIEGIVNVGSGVSTSNREIVEIVFDVMNKRVPVNIVDRIDGHTHITKDSPIWVCDNTKLKSYGWESKISLREGIKSML